jgi:hypothetical protein
MGRSKFDCLNRMVPFIPKVTTIANYHPYQNIQWFLQQKYREIPKDRKWRPLELDSWMENLGGWKNKVKFMRRVTEGWLCLALPIPVRFLELLGTDYEELFRVLEFDKADYRDAVNHLPSPRYFQYRVMACVYPTVELPENCTEENAIKYVMDFMKTESSDKNSYAHIYFGYLKTIYISSMDYHTVYHEPSIYLNKDHITCKKSSPFSVVMK